MSSPILAIIGRPNVGKSTLFNCLSRSHQALVSDFPGLTRDRQYGRGLCDEKAYWVIDTGGFAGAKENASLLQSLLLKQVQTAITEADGILFLVDVKEGLMPQDLEIANTLRGLKKPVWLLVNKVDHAQLEWMASDFFKLGFGKPHCISTAHKKGVLSCLESILRFFPLSTGTSNLPVDRGVPVATVGRPNVGKSTLINTLLKEDRVIVSEVPGTTRDSIHIPFVHQGTHYTLIDTAGVRRKGKVFEKIEKFSVVKALQAIEEAKVVVVMIDATEGVVEQDLKLVGYVIQAGKSFVIAVNKWDALSSDEQKNLKGELHRKLPFASYAQQIFISAKMGMGVHHLLAAIRKTHHCATKDISTALLTRLLEEAVEQHQPPIVRGRRIKLRYAHLGGRTPPVIVIHGNQACSLPKSYQRYLQNYYREKLKLVGTPILLELRKGENPFKD